MTDDYIEYAGNLKRRVQTKSKITPKYKIFKFVTYPIFTMSLPSQTNAKLLSFVTNLSKGEPTAVARCPLSMAHWTNDGHRIITAAHELDLSFNSLLSHLLGDSKDEEYINAVIGDCVEHMVNHADVFRRTNLAIIVRHARCLKIETLAKVASLVVTEVSHHHDIGYNDRMHARRWRTFCHLPCTGANAFTTRLLRPSRGHVNHIRSWGVL